eukprot:4096425-Lingulodinium_polyedra.AAC.1
MVVLEPLGDASILRAPAVRFYCPLRAAGAVLQTALRVLGEPSAKFLGHSFRGPAADVAYGQGC